MPTLCTQWFLSRLCIRGFFLRSLILNVIYALYAGTQRLTLSGELNDKEIFPAKPI